LSGRREASARRADNFHRGFKLQELRTLLDQVTDFEKSARGTPKHRSDIRESEAQQFADANETHPRANADVEQGNGGRIRLMSRIWIGLVLGAVLGAAGTAVLLTFGGIRLERSETSPSVSAKDFSDGIGIYALSDGKYQFLYWRKKLFNPGAAADEKDIAEAAQAAIPVKKGVRFFSYGLDVSKWPVVPPYAMALCTIRDMQVIEGVFPIRIKPVDGRELIYELLLPPVVDSLGSNALWAINFQYSCQEGWVFRFQ
jgi:hypothetical protein